MNNDPQGERGASEKSKGEREKENWVLTLSLVLQKKKKTERTKGEQSNTIQSLSIAAASTLSFFVPSSPPTTPHNHRS